jgi:hypothetical protein
MLGSEMLLYVVRLHRLLSCLWRPVAADAVMRSSGSYSVAVHSLYQTANLGVPSLKTHARRGSVLSFGPAPSENMVLPSIFVSEE